MISVAKGMGFSNQLQAASLNPFLHRISQKNLLGQGFSSYPEGFSVSFYPHGRNFICHFFSSFVEILSMYLRFTHLKCTVPWLSLYSQSCIAVTKINFRMFSSHQTENMHPLVVTRWHPLSSQPLTTTDPFSFSLDLPFLAISYKRDYTGCGPLWLFHLV